MAYNKEYVFPLTLTPAWRAEIQGETQSKLTDMLGVEVDTVMAEYVLVMVGNKKNMAQIAHDLIDFIGEESAEQFVEWLSALLPSYEAKGAASGAQADDAELAPPAAESSKNDQEGTTTSTSSTTPTTKRIISLKGSSTNSDKKLVSLSSSRGTVRTLNRAPKEVDDVLAKRSQRFGVVEKTSPKKKPAREEPKPVASATKRKASTEPESSEPAHTQRRGSGGRLSQLLGPPVNVDQAELDARDSLNTNKKKKVNPRSADSDRERSGRSNNGRSDRNNQENQDSDSNRKSRRTDEKDQPRQGAAPPLPPSDHPERGDRFDGRNGGGRGPMHGQQQHGGYYNGPPGYGGGFPPPYGHPMYFQPPPFGQMPPYGMGYPPHHGGSGHFHGAPGPYGAPPVPPMPGVPHHGGRAPRPAFQNKKWVNPNVAKAEEAQADDANTESAAPAENSSAAPNAGLNPGASTFAPRNPFYPSQMRPRFQNKTWVRPEPAKDEEFSLSLPTTPPPEGVDNESME